MNRIQYIDRLKGFTIFLVVMGHVSVFCYQAGAGAMDRFIGSFHMPLFMFLSGIVTKTPIFSKNGIGNWLRKIGALLLPLCVFGFCFTLYCTGTSNIGDILTKVWSFVSSNNKMGYWYLFDLALFYVTMPIFLLNKRKRWWNDAILGVLVEAIFYMGWKPENILTDVMCLLNAASFYPFFVMGYIVKKYNLMEKLQRQNWIFSISLITYLFMFAFPFQNHALHTLTWRLLMPLTGILSCLLVFANRENEDSWIERQLSFIGKNTLDVYILHYFLISSINLTMVGQWFDGTNNGLLATILAIIITVPITYLSVYAGKLLRKSKFLNDYAFGDIFRKK